MEHERHTACGESPASRRPATDRRRVARSPFAGISSSIIMIRRAHARHGAMTSTGARHAGNTVVRARHAATLRSGVQRLWACVVVIALLVTGAVFALGWKPASAFANDSTETPASASSSSNGSDNSTGSADATPGTCTEKTVALGGGSTSLAQADTGVATYVGKDMYIGGRPSNLSSLENATGPNGTYAAEAEGLTVVNGKLAMKQIKNSWGGMGFRFGNTGYGTQYRPAANNTVLAVGRRNGKSVTLGGGTDAGEIAVQAWNASDNTFATDTNRGSHMNLGGGWVGFPSGGETENMNYNIRIAGPETHAWGSPSAPSLYQYNKDTLNSNGVGTIQPLPSSQTNQFANDFTVNGTDYSGFGSQISQESAALAALATTGSVSYATAPRPNEHYLGSKHNYVIDPVKYKYDWFAQEVWNVNPVATYEYIVKDSSLENEKLITFTGDGSSTLQVFNLPAEELDSSQYTGVDFWFRGIPQNASVVINVTGSKPIDFHNGWRFWWGGDADTSADTFITQASSSSEGVRDISNDYARQSNTDADRVAEYSRRAQHVLWNFTDTSSLTIRGGQAAGTQYWKASSDSYNVHKNGAMTVSDDPSATWMGSILLPNGDFESHVSTAGRVYIGGDFQMYNPTPVAYTSASGKQVTFVNWEGGNSASAIDMDQVRYNLPWSGQITSQCSMLRWQVASDTSGNPLLGGTSWGVYASADDARNGKNPILTVTDDGSNDWDAQAGSIEVKGVAPLATYYLHQLTAPQPYDINTNTYVVYSGAKGANANWVSNAVDNTGSWNSTLGLINVGGHPATVNHYDPSISWKVIDASDPSHTGEAGTTWSVQRLDAVGTVIASWTVADDSHGSVACDTTQASCDAEPSRGIVTLHADASGAPLKDGTYRITQLTAGNGFVRDTTPITCTLSGGIATWQGIASGEQMTVGNAHIGGVVSWTLTDTSNDPLGHSQWTITQTGRYRFDASTQQYTYQPIAQHERTTLKLADCEQAQDSTATAGCNASSDDASIRDTNTARGQLAVSSLDWGTYEIRQTSTANGYHPSTRVTEVTIGPASSSAVDADRGFGKVVTQPDVDHWVNTSDVLLPYAGGDGGHWPFALIALITAVAALLLAAAIRFRSRRTI